MYSIHSSYINLDVNLKDAAAVFFLSFTSGSYREWSSVASLISPISYITHAA